jgi:biopolymer transport protein ExbD
MEGAVMPYAASAETPPIGEINTTPLIDVMLVLLIMIIITMPVQSHVVKVDLPGPPPNVTIDRLKNKLVITARDETLWNGVPVTVAELKHVLGTVARLPDQPELHLQPEPAARYALVDEVLAETKRAQIARLGFVGNEGYAHF